MTSLVNFSNSLWDTTAEDVFSYTESETKLKPQIIFSIDGEGEVYRLFRDCANPYGGIGLLIPPPDDVVWQLEPIARVESIKHVDGSVTYPPLPGLEVTAEQGAGIRWEHSITNPDGSFIPGTTLPQFKYRNGVFLGGADAGLHTYPTDPPFLSGPANWNDGQPPGDYYITASDIPIGSRVCKSTIVDPTSSFETGWSPSAEACVTIIAPIITGGWNIIPSTTVEGTPESGQTITWHHTITNNGPDPSPALEYKYENTVGMGGGGGPPTPSGTWSQGSGLVANGGSVTSDSTYPIASTDTGMLCRRTLVRPYNSGGQIDGGEWRVSDQACVTIGTPTTSGWEITPSTTVKVTPVIVGVPIGKAKSGQTIKWTHTITNIGPDSTDYGINYRYENNGPLGGGGGPTSYPFIWSKGYPWAKNTPADQPSTYPVTSVDKVGSRLCRKTLVSPFISTNKTGTGWRSDTEVCVEIVAPPTSGDWSITPSTTVSIPGVTIVPGVMPEVTQKQNITWTHIITNNGPASTTARVNYKNGNNTALGGGGGPSPPWFSVEGLGSQAKANRITNEPAAAYAVGSVLCRSTLAQPYISTNLNPTKDDWKKSDDVCVKVIAPPPPPPTPPSNCSPIIFYAEPRTYPAVPASPYNPGGYPAVGARIVPITVSSNKPYTFNPTGITIRTSFDATQTHTTGDSYTVTATEDGKHLVRYQDNGYTTDDLTKPIYQEIIDPVTLIPKEVLIGYEQKWVYTGTDIIYDGPESWPVETPKGNGIIGPCYNYRLTAQVAPSTTPTREPAFSDVIEVNSSVKSEKYDDPSNEYPLNHFDDVPHTKSRKSQWQLTKLIFQPGESVLARGNENSDSSPCDHFVHPSCTPVVTRTDIIFLPTTTSIPEVLVPITEDYKPGTKICFVLSVKPHAGWDEFGEDSRWNHSGLSKDGNCVTIVKKPKVQVWGGDLLSKEKVVTSTSDKTVNTISARFGSWTEYGIIAGSTITGTASGSAYANNGLVGSVSDACNYSHLSFTNTPCSGTIGMYTNVSAHNMPNVAASFAGAASPLPGPDLSSVTLSGVYTMNGSVISGGTIPKGRWIVINSPGQDITISGDIKYESTGLQSIGDIPQVVIIAKNITIADTVGQVDAWLIAKDDVSKSGFIKTCTTEAKDINTCKEQLIVNGPVITNNLYLDRTFGSEPCDTTAGITDCKPSGVPAEIFNLRADAYLWAVGRASEEGRIQTVYTTELPPRL